MREVRMERMRPAEIVAEMKERPLVFLPVGPLEWHGPHLPLGTDPLIAYGVARRVAARVGGVVLPALFVGTERERSPELLQYLGFKGDEYIVGMDFPANILKGLYYREEFFALVVRETLDLLVQQGYRLIVILNGHGADNQLGVLGRLSAEFTGRGPARVFYISAWTQSDQEVGSGHAGAEETSHVMALYPGLVNLSTLPTPDQPLRNVDWAIVDALTFDGHPSADFTTRDDPRVGATAERGEESLGRAVTYIARRVAEAMVDLGYETLPTDHAG
jgi:creatinine amidohydrolase